MWWNILSSVIEEISRESIFGAHNVLTSFDDYNNEY